MHRLAIVRRSALATWIALVVPIWCCCANTATAHTTPTQQHDTQQAHDCCPPPESENTPTDKTCDDSATKITAISSQTHTTKLQNTHQYTFIFNTPPPSTSIHHIPSSYTTAPNPPPTDSLLSKHISLRI